MQNRYVGDVGDFGKYHLLKSLCLGGKGEQSLSLGVVWYLVSDENHNEDGKHIRYLERTASNLARFRKGDPTLYDALAEIIETGKRDVTFIRENNVMPTDTAFYDSLLSFKGMSNNSPIARLKRIRYRENWLMKALDTTLDCDIIFVDPDNGLEVNSVERHQKTGPKYTYFDELAPFIKRGQSLVIYHHLCRSGPAEVQVRERLDQIKEKLGIDDVYALLYKRGTLRVFFVVPSRENKELLWERGVHLTHIVPWKEHFSVID